MQFNCALYKINYSYSYASKGIHEHYVVYFALLCHSGLFYRGNIEFLCSFLPQKRTKTKRSELMGTKIKHLSIKIVAADIGDKG